MENSNNNSLVKIVMAIVAIGALVVVASIVIWKAGGLTQGTNSGGNEWLTYSNEKYSFEIKYPKDWQVVVDDSGEPKINIFKKTETEKPPFIHHSNVTHVSIYPKGIGTEGVQGESAPSGLQFQETMKTATDFLLKDGATWATYANIDTKTTNWQPWGFLWAGLKVESRKTECIQPGKIPIQGACDLGVEFKNSKTVVSGTVNEADREIQEEILRSFRFFNADTPITSGTSRVNIYVVDIEGKGDQGKTIGCGDGLVAVKRDVAATQGVLRAALNELFSLKTRTYGESGYVNALYQSNIKVDSASVVDGEAQVHLSGQVASGGVCDDPRIVEQIKATVMQFPTVKGAEITLNGRDLNDYFSQR
ncbi:GerMN domain-containing protein [Candidatus Parcubacteria bacterium]|nr:GerMN domain-containing protein [Candidatus Parcubacteria bacterium]